MNKKLLLLLLFLLSYFLLGLTMYAFLKPNTRADTILRSVNEANVNQGEFKVNDCGCNATTMPIVCDTQADSLQKKEERNSFYFGKYKTPTKLLNASKQYCLDSEMNMSYFEICLSKYKGMIKNEEYTKVVEGLTNFMYVDPPVEISSGCTPPRLPYVMCEEQEAVFGKGATRAETKRKIGILIQLGFDIDMLEVYLWEVYDVVDKFFITESLITHSDKQIRKPLIWEKIKHTHRFERFTDKIVHFIVDDSDMTQSNGDNWASERNQEKVRWEKFKEWNLRNKFFGDDDVIGFGDTDEIPSRDALAVLKQCTGDLGQRIDIGTTFFFGNYEDVYGSDFYIRGYPYTLGDPTFFTLKYALKYSGTEPYPTRMRGRSEKYLLGGAHISPYLYLPTLINKAIVATEERPLDIVTGSMEELEDYYKEDIRMQFSERIANATKIMNDIQDHYYIPWIMKCVPDRYPSFFKKRDPRLYYPPCFFDFEC